jgi:hypothetical protein
MDLLNSLNKSIEKINGAARVAKIFWLVNTTRSFPPLNADIARAICEFAAELDAATAKNLYITSRDIKIWCVNVFRNGLFF